MKRQLTDLENTWADNLKEIWASKKKSLGLTQEKAGHALGITQAGVSHYLNKTQSLSIAYKLKWAMLLDVPVTDIDPNFEFPSINTKEGSAEAPSSELFSMSSLNSEAPLDDNIEVEVPFFREVAVSERVGLSEVVENHGPKSRFSRASLHLAGVAPEDAAWCFATGDSMGNVIPNGASIGIDRGFSQIIDGEIYAMNHGGMLKIKYLYRLPNGGIRIRSELNDEYPDEDLTGKEVGLDLEIIGFVFWISIMRTARKAR